MKGFSAKTKETPAVLAAEQIGMTEDIEAEDPLLEDLALRSPRFGEAAEKPDGIIRSSKKLSPSMPVQRIWMELLGRSHGLGEFMVHF